MRPECAVLAAFLGLAAAVSARSAEPESGELRDVPGNTLHEKLEMLYKQGMAPTPSDIDGWIAGRMVTRGEPDKPRASVLVALPHSRQIAYINSVTDWKGELDRSHYDDITQTKLCGAAAHIAGAVGGGVAYFRDQELEQEVEAYSHFYRTIFQLAYRRSGAYIVMKHPIGYAYYFRRAASSASFRERRALCPGF